MTEQIKVELKGIKHFIGREGYGLNASLYVNGKKCAFVMDDANGGSMDYDITDKALWNVFEKYAKEKFPFEESDRQYFDQTIYSLELDNEMKKEAKKATKKGETVIAVGDKYITYKAPYSTRIVDHIIKQHPDAIFIQKKYELV